MIWTHGDIDGTAFVDETNDDGIHVTGKVDHYSTAILTSINGSITIDGKVDNNSNVSITAMGDVTIGGEALDGGSSVVVISDDGSITIAGKVDGSSYVSLTASGDIHLEGKIDNNSTVIMISHHGKITIDGKVDGNSNVSLTAAGDISIGVVGGDGDKKIDGNSHVDATSGGVVSLGNKIDSSNASVDFKACDGITIGDKIDGGATVRLLTGTGSITVVGKIDNSATQVTFWPPGSLQVMGSIQGGAQVDAKHWSVEPLCMTLPSVVEYWWQNWPHTFGYVSPLRSLPRSLAEISEAIVGGGTSQAPRERAIKAVGGGWSFTDASLPFRTQAEVDQVSTLLRGASGAADFHNILQGINNVTSSPVDLLPEAVTSAVSFSTHYDQPSMTQQTTTGALLPGSKNVQLIDTRSLASSLQCELDGILLEDAKRRYEGSGTYLFHVEAGITMADLDPLLDHQSPRMAIQASGGSPGATLAGTLSTATHGEEFRWPLLIGRVPPSTSSVRGARNGG